MRCSLLLILGLWSVDPAGAQSKISALGATEVEQLLADGYTVDDLSELVVRDRYVSHSGAVQHVFFQQRHAGIEVFQGDIAVHRRADGHLIAMHAQAVRDLARRVNTTTPVLTPDRAMDVVLRREGIEPEPAPEVEYAADRSLWTFRGMPTVYDEVHVRSVYQPVGEAVLLAWEVEFQLRDGSHWWQVRIDATTGVELDRNDLVSNCSFDVACNAHACPHPAAPGPPPLPNDLNVYAWPVESPGHGGRTLQNAPWGQAPNASPFGWNDIDGVPGAEYQITRGNNVYAQEDMNGNNGTGYSPSGGAALAFDFPIDLSQAPSTYTDASVTNLFYWNNLMHDVWYQYGFDEVSGNFQANNYGNGGAANDHVLADAQDGSGMNNANFATPADGTNPRMQMYLWSGSPDIDGDLDNGIIAHEYGHGISNRLVGGPSMVSCLNNSEQMGEGWSDLFGLVMTMETGDQGTDARGVGTFADGQPPNGPGIRPAPYSTDMGVNGYTYGSTNSGLSQPHGIGFVWCTILWEVTWELIGTYGFDPDLYAGTGGNNIAMQLVIDGMKLTPCHPGFVDARDAILLADQVVFGGANQALLWEAFARRGLGYSASQGSPYSRSDQVEAFDTPLAVNGGCAAIVSPTSAPLGGCAAPGAVAVKALFSNNGTQPIQDLPVRYRLDGGPIVAETVQGVIHPGADTVYTFLAPLVVQAVGPHELETWCALPGDGSAFNDSAFVQFDVLPDIGATELVLKPGPNDGKDAFIWWLTTQTGPYGPTNSSNYGAQPDLQAMEWTWSGSPGHRHSLIEFDLTSLPPGSDIHFAELSLYQNTTSVDGGHSSQSGSNAAVLQRVTGVWDESTVTWNNRPPVVSSGQVVLAQSTSPTQDYPGIDVTTMVTDMVLDTAHGHGFQLSTIAAQQYRKMTFASSDHPDPSRWPELRVCYTPPAQVAMKVILDGPWTSGSVLMHDSLRTNGLLPLTEPYSALGFLQAGNGGGETIGADLLAVDGPDAVVDWIHLALSTSLSQSDVVATRCALLQRDGDVVDLDGTSPVVFYADEGFYHVIVRHRNHLGVVTAQAIHLSTAQVGQIDLTGPLPITYGVDAQKIEGGKLVLWAGDVTSDGVLKYAGANNDRDAILQALGGTSPNTVAVGYGRADVNMDGMMKYAGVENDRDPILLNVGGLAPTNTRSAQLP
ncbi:MAG: M36 family metallopeptidase [Flavobacteriales bacterium]|nr:M36 family metallopeptidase [Flavobacteriales bacterium]